MKLHFLHGFLGFPTDGDSFKDDFKPYAFKAYSIADFLPRHSVQNKNSFQEWANHFNTHIFSTQNIDKPGRKNIIVGYSLGGRFALHSLIDLNSKWDGAIIISANPGLFSETEKINRVKNDTVWANRFLNELWNTVMADWNAQGVFSNQKNSFHREEKFYDKQNIFRMLTEFSLGKQENLRPYIQMLNIPVLWISGQLDTKFCAIGAEMSLLNKNIINVSIKNAGHRIPWESKREFIEVCKSFLQTKIASLQSN